MKWISRTHETLGVAWKEEGWFFDTPTEDYGTKLRCRKCHTELRVDECQKEALRGYLGDDCGAPVFYLCCTQCHAVLAVIDEVPGEFRPMLNIKKDGEFVVDPSVT